MTSRDPASDDEYVMCVYLAYGELLQTFETDSLTDSCC